MPMRSATLPSQTPHVDDRLNSWKEIATYLNRTVRTVRRWEREEGLPVHRHNHQKQASVYSFKTELDEWEAARRPATEASAQAGRRPARFGFLRIWFAVTAVFGAGLILLLLYGMIFRNWRFLIRL